MLDAVFYIINRVLINFIIEDRYVSKYFSNRVIM